MSLGIESHTPAGWRATTFDNLKKEGDCTFVGGPFGSNLTSRDYVEGTGVPVIRGANLDGKRSEFIDHGFVYVTHEKAAELQRNLAFPGDMIFTQRGTLGQVGIIPDDATHAKYVVSQSQMKLTVDRQKACAKYLYYYYRSPLAAACLAQRVLATGVPHINLGILKSFPVLLPPLAEQRRIAAILDKADAIRRKRREAIALTEELLRSTFLEMFGDPVTNPKGWPVILLGTQVDGLKYGTSTKCRDEPARDGVPVLRIPNIKRERIAWSELKYASLAQKEFRTLALEHGDLIFVRSNGNPAYIARCAVFDDARPAVYASYLIRARFSEEAVVHPEFVRDQVSYPTYRQRLVREARTTAGNYNINTKALARLSLIAPPIDLQRQYLSICNNMDAFVDRQERALMAANDLFHSLVQRAFRGEL